VRVLQAGPVRFLALLGIATVALVTATSVDGVRALKQQSDLGAGLTIPAGCSTWG
jgi:hypothetical protein